VRFEVLWLFPCVVLFVSCYLFIVAPYQSVICCKTLKLKPSATMEDKQQTIKQNTTNRQAINLKVPGNPTWEHYNSQQGNIV
jgi:hypothetical protein